MAQIELKNAYRPKNFLDLCIPEEVTFEDADAIVLPFGYEGTVTYGQGTSQGPQALIEATWQTELFDDEILDDIQNQIKIWTTEQPPMPSDALAAAALLKNCVKAILELGKFPVVIGGEHSISYGFAQAVAEKYGDVSVLVFDAHMDLGDRYSGKDFTHAAWLKYSLDLPNIKNATLLGIRNFNKLEWEYWQQNKDRVKVYQAKNKSDWRLPEIIDGLDHNVYLSFDIDAFDSSVMPATGTPEPGGLFWDEVLPIVRAVAAQKNIVGLDLVELAPIQNLHAPDFLAAKLLMKMILYKFRARQLIT